MSSPIIDFIPKFTEVAQNEAASIEKSSWNGRQVFHLYTELFPELQMVIANVLDDSTRMSFYLTCKSLYYTPERPRMLWREFAKAAMLDGNVDLVKFGLELGIDLDDFVDHVPEVARRNYKEIFQIEELKQCIDEAFGGADLFVPALAYAAEHQLFDDYEWITLNFKTTKYVKKRADILGYIRASNLEALKTFSIDFHNPAFYEQAFKYANLDVINWLLTNDSFRGLLEAIYFRHLGFRKEFEVVEMLYQAFPHFLSSIVEGAVYYENVALLDYLKGFGGVSVQELPSTHLPRACFDSKTFFENLSSDEETKLEQISYRLERTRSRDNYQLINFLLDHLDEINEDIVEIILNCPEASFSQIKRAFESYAAKEGNSVENLLHDLDTFRVSLKKSDRLRVFSEYFNKSRSLGTVEEGHQPS